jgi:hypothetical protein
LSEFTSDDESYDPNEDEYFDQNDFLTNDGAYVPPTDLSDLFTHGSPLFESSDWAKFDREDMSSEEFKAFRLGWECRMIDTFLKCGIAFQVPIEGENLHRIRKRCEAFNRTLTIVRFTDSSTFCLVMISGHA